MSLMSGKELTSQQFCVEDSRFDAGTSGSSALAVQVRKQLSILRSKKI